MATERSQGGVFAEIEKEPRSGLDFGREPARLALLLVLAVMFFVAVSGLSRVYHAQQASLGSRWFSRGSADLQSRNYERAVGEFRTALLYSRDDYSYQLNLAEALIGQGRTAEAYAYLVNLWERKPENGSVNLALARIAAQKGQTGEAIRYYHNAIYAVWSGEQEREGQDVRLELAEFLLRINAKTQAQAELIALAPNLNGDPAQHARAGDLFLRAQDYEHALSEYHLTLKSDRHNSEALAGAGRSAFELGRYPLAQRYLQGAVSADPKDAESAARLETTDLVMQMDPFQRKISAAERNRIVMQAYEAAGGRLQACPAVANSKATAANGRPGLSEQWEQMKRQITEPGLRRNPDQVEAAMDLVFAIERQTSAACGQPTGKDLALLLIAKLHEGN